MRILCLILLLLVGCSGSKDKAIEYFALETPRPFGYVIGDEIEQHIIVETLPGITLQTASLPGQGQLNRWLNLNEVVVKQQQQRYEITLRYQLFYAALEVKALKLPGFTLQLNDGKQTLDKEVPAWEFTVSPLRELSVRKTESGEYMRPDATSLLLSDAQSVVGLTVSAIASLLIAIYLAYLYGCMPMAFKRLLFKRALKQLAKLSIDNMDQALTVMHQAFNRLNQKPLFQNQLADFYQRFPHYRSISTELDWFFQYSNRYFFTERSSVNAQDLDKIKSLCSHCRQIERGSR